MWCKVLKCKGSVVLRYTSSVDNLFDAQVARVLGQGFPATLLPFSVVEASPSTTEVHYDVTRLVTLSEYAKTPLGAEALRALLDQIRQLMESCMAMKLPLKNIVLDANQVYCDPWANHALRFVYLPFEGIAPDVGAMRAFFAGLTGILKSPQASAQPLIDRYDAFFAETPLFSPAGYLAFLAELMHPAGAIDRASSPLPAGPIADKKRRGKHVRIDPGTGVLNQVSWKMATGQDVVDPPVSEAPYSGKAAPVSSGPFATTVLEKLSVDAEQGTIVLDEFADMPPASPPPTPLVRFYLTHRRSGERFEVHSEEFVVGKSKYCSYQVRDTNTVSRRHAVFHCCDDACWIEDNGSTNGTSVDGTPLGPHERFRLRGGESIRMSDEGFTFEAVSC